MTRYAIRAGDHWVVALYGQRNGIGYTDIEEDASNWVTYERAVEAARVVIDAFDGPVCIQSVVEPPYFKSW